MFRLTLARHELQHTLAVQMKKLLAPAFALLFALFATACSSSSDFSGLGLELTRLERSAEGTVTATVRITNANVVAYNFSQCRHDIIVDGREIGTLVITTPTGIPSQTTVEQTGAVTLKRGAELPTGAVAYQLKSDIVVRLYGDRTDNKKLGGRGTVMVKQ